MVRAALLGAYFLSLSLLLSCVRGEPKSDKVVAYENGGSMMGVPVINRRNVVVAVTGRVLPAKPLAPLPRKLVVFLQKSGKTLAEAKPQSDGSFAFHSQMSKGVYSVVAQAEHFRGERQIEIESATVEGVEVALSQTR